MDSRPPNLLLWLLLTSLLHFWQYARGQSSYTIDAVGLRVLPSSTVQSGTQVILQCWVNVSHDNIPHLRHTFQLTRDDVLINYHNTTEDSVVLKLSPARAADSGSYECRVTVKEKSKASLVQKLDVTGLQTPILYLNKTTPYENEEFMAVCSAPEERGSLIFRFYQRFRNGASEMIKRSASSGNSTETKLVLRKAGDSFLYCDYEINLVSGARRSNQSNEISVLVKELFISPVMNVLPSFTVFEGDVMKVVCKVVNSLTNIEVFLKRDQRILKQAPVSLIHEFTAEAGDSGELVCKAEWGNVQKETNTKITVKEVFSKPRLTVAPLDIFEGERFKLTCSVTIYAPEKLKNETMKFSIYRDNIKLTSTETYITVAEQSKNGIYSCEVQAPTPGLVKTSQRVVVQAKVPVSKPVLSVVGGTLVLGKRFQLLCHSDTGTLPIVYTLYSPNRLVEHRMVSKPGEQAIFNSSAIYKSSDLNTFLCRANNSQHKITVTDTGHLLRTANIIVPVAIPVLRMLPRMSDVSEGQDVTLECSVQRGTLPINITWYHTETEGALASQISKTLARSYKITNVSGKHQGGYYCVCTNQANETTQSNTITIGVKLAGWKKGLIAAFCILLILSLILVLTFKRHLLRFKRKTTGTLSVKSTSSKAERLSLTQAEINEAANVTPGMMGKSVWSEHVSGCESDDQNSMASLEKPEPQYTEVQTKQADANSTPVKKGTDTVYSEVRNSSQGVPEPADGQGSVEYAQLNHDADHHIECGNHGDHRAQDDYTNEIDSSVDSNTADHGE